MKIDKETKNERIKRSSSIREREKNYKRNNLLRRSLLVHSSALDGLNPSPQRRTSSTSIVVVHSEKKSKQNNRNSHTQKKMQVGLGSKNLLHQVQNAKAPRIVSPFYSFILPIQCFINSVTLICGNADKILPGAQQCVSGQIIV